MPHILRTVYALPDDPGDLDTASSPDPQYGYPDAPRSKHEQPRILLPSKKRKRVDYSADLDIEDALEDRLKGDATIEFTASSPKKRKQCSRIRLPSLVFPKSQYHNWHPPLPVSKERDVLAEFMVKCRS